MDKSLEIREKNRKGWALIFLLVGVSLIIGRIFDDLPLSILLIGLICGTGAIAYLIYGWIIKKIRNGQEFKEND